MHSRRIISSSVYVFPRKPLHADTVTLFLKATAAPARCLQRNKPRRRRGRRHPAPSPTPATQVAVPFPGGLPAPPGPFGSRRPLGWPSGKDTPSPAGVGVGGHGGRWVGTHSCAEGQQGAGPGGEPGGLKGSDLRPPGSVRLGAAPAAGLLRAGRGRHGQRRGDGRRRGHGGGRAGGEHGEGAGEGEGEALGSRRGRGGGSVDGSGEGQERGRERGDAGSDAAGGGDSEGGVGVGEGGREQGGPVGRHVRGESARGGVGGVQAARLQQSSREVVEGGCPVVRVQGVVVVVVGHGGGHGGGFPLRGAGAQVGHQSHAQGVRCVETFHRSQVPRHLCQALPEADAHEIHGQGMSVKITCKGRAKGALSAEGR